MIGRQEDTPRVVDQQQQFQADGPLHGVDQVASLVGVRHDAAAGLVFDIEIAPLAARQLIEQMLPRAVGGDGDGVAEEDGAGVAGEVRVRVEVRRRSASPRSAWCASRRRRRRGTADGPCARGGLRAPSSFRAWWRRCPARRGCCSADASGAAGPAHRRSARGSAMIFAGVTLL